MLSACVVFSCSVPVYGILGYHLILPVRHYGFVNSMRVAVAGQRRVACLFFDTFFGVVLLVPGAVLPLP